MKKLIKLSTLVFAVSICSAQANSTSNVAANKQYRLTFVVSYPDGQAPKSFTVDVPLVAGQTGIASISAASGTAAQTIQQQTIQCNDVHESPKGLAANVSIAMDSVPSDAVPGDPEAIHRHFQFNKQFDVALDKPTRISEEMHYKVLNKGVATEAPMPPSKAAPQISVTVTAI